MRYTVTWTSATEKRLASIWMSSSDRNSISTAANAIDQDLALQPLQVGESRSGRTRIHVVSSLAVFYDVYPDDMRVTVWAIWKRQA